MIVQCGKVSIDTDMDHVAHKTAIEKKTGFHCEEDKPVYWFTQKEGVDGADRYFHLRYNKAGTELQKIDSWDEAKDRMKKVKKIKGGEKMCYFMRQGAKGKEEYEWVDEKDYGAPIAENEIVHWEKGWSEPAYGVNPIKKKPWWKFF